MGDGVVPEAPQGLFEHDSHLHSGEVGAEAAVAADTEGEIPVGLTVEKHLVGAVEHLGIAVGRAPEQEYRLAGGNRAPPDLDVSGDRAGESLNRCLEAEELVDCGGQEVRVGREAAALVVVELEVQEAAADGRHRGVEAADRDHHQQVHHLVATEGSGGLQTQQVRDHVVAGRRGTLGYTGGEALADGPHAVPGGLVVRVVGGIGDEVMQRSGENRPVLRR